jgi:hypothetical protein
VVVMMRGNKSSKSGYENEHHKGKKEDQKRDG